MVVAPVVTDAVAASGPKALPFTNFGYHSLKQHATPF